MAAKKTEVAIEIRKPEIKRVPIRIVGDSPLIIHAMSAKSKRMMLEAQQGKTKTKKKELRRPFLDFFDSLYWLTEKPEDPGTDEELEEVFEKAVKEGAKFGFPVTGIKQAGNSAAYRAGWVKNQMGLRGAYYIQSEYGEFAEIKGDAPEIREDAVIIGMGTSDLRYRPIFHNWYMDFVVEYDSNGQYSLEDIINVINIGGYSCGIGEWRVEKDGIFGRYHIETN